MNKDNIRKRLKNLIGRRFSINLLKEKLSELFDCKVNIDKIDESILLPCEDYRIDFYCNEYDGTIWYAETRAKDIIVLEINLD